MGNFDRNGELDIVALFSKKDLGVTITGEEGRLGVFVTGLVYRVYIELTSSTITSNFPFGATQIHYEYKLVYVIFIKFKILNLSEFHAFIFKKKFVIIYFQHLKLLF